MPKPISHESLVAKGLPGISPGVAKLAAHVVREVPVRVEESEERRCVARISNGRAHNSEGRM